MKYCIWFFLIRLLSDWRCIVLCEIDFLLKQFADEIKWSLVESKVINNNQKLALCIDEVSKKHSLVKL